MMQIFYWKVLRSEGRNKRIQGFNIPSLKSSKLKGTRLMWILLINYYVTGASAQNLFTILQEWLYKFKSKHPKTITNKFLFARVNS